jgi:hypothetical protein
MKRLRSLAAVAAVTMLAGCGGEDEKPQKDPFLAISGKAPPKHTGAAPRWEHLATFTGKGSATKPVTIDRRAIQWRVRWRCEPGGELEITATPAPPGGKPLTRHRCPAHGTGMAIQTGALKLNVAGSGAWRVKVEQQVDTPLREKPLAGMSTGRRLAQGAFYMVDKPGKGTANVYRLPNGRLALRLEGFQTSANIDLFVWLSEARKPKTTADAFAAKHVVASELKSTIGDQNYLLPRGVDPDRIRSIVIWCEPVRNVYVAAALR